jgi:hypothetical protein
MILPCALWLEGASASSKVKSSDGMSSSSDDDDDDDDDEKDESNVDLSQDASDDEDFVAPPGIFFCHFHAHFWGHCLVKFPNTT